MILTEELLESLVEEVHDKLSSIEGESGFDILSLYPYLNEIPHDDGTSHQEIEIQIEYRNINNSDTIITTYNKVVYENEIPDIEQVLFDDILDIVKP